MLTNEVPTNKLLKSFTVKKDANGAYSLNFDLNSDAVVDKTYNDYSKTSQFVLYSSNKPGVRNVKEPMSINDSKLQIGFLDTNTDEKPSITIVDDNITFGKGDTEALQSFEISSVDDSAYQLDFICFPVGFGSAHCLLVITSAWLSSGEQPLLSRHGSLNAPMTIYR